MLQTTPLKDYVEKQNEATLQAHRSHLDPEHLLENQRRNTEDDDSDDNYYKNNSGRQYTPRQLSRAARTGIGRMLKFDNHSDGPARPPRAEQRATPLRTPMPNRLDISLESMRAVPSSTKRGSGGSSDCLLLTETFPVVRFDKIVCVCFPFCVCAGRSTPGRHTTPTQRFAQSVRAAVADHDEREACAKPPPPPSASPSVGSEAPVAARLRFMERAQQRLRSIRSKSASLRRGRR